MLRAEYQRGMMDAVTDPRNEDITIMTSSQVGKTQIIKNIIGYYIDQDPSPILALQPTLEMARSFSKERLTPMLRDTPCLRGKVKEARAKDSSNEILHKTFPGGHITIAGANSPASLASRPIRILLPDEIDRYPPSAGSEGDPVDLARKRTRTFWNRKIVTVSSPTTRGVSRIQRRFLQSDQRHCYVQCPVCGHAQILIFSDASEFADLGGGRLRFDSANVSWVHYECESCKKEIPESAKFRMIAGCTWIARRPEVVGHAGFHLSELYSTFSTWKYIAEEFLKAKRARETLRVWINTSLGETFEEEQALTISDAELASRVEKYDKIPRGALFLTGAVDVQDDRLEAMIMAWGAQEESWLMSWQAFYGIPDRGDVWEAADEWLSAELEHETGGKMRPMMVFVDSGGHFSQTVYRFTKARQGRRYYAVKGYGGSGKPLIGKPTRNNREHAVVVPLGVDDAKRLIYDRLEKAEPGPGQMHFNQVATEDYFRQLTAEKQVIKMDRGFPVRVWKLKREGQRNEVLDLTVYNLCAMKFLNPNWKKLAERVVVQAKPPTEAEVEKVQGVKPHRKRFRIKGFSRGRW